MESDVAIVKNYLIKLEIKDLERIVNAFLDFAERHIPMTMEDWSEILDKYLLLDEREILTNAGTISHELAEEKALLEFEKYRVIQDKLFKSDSDKFITGVEKIEEDNKSKGY